MHCHYAQWPHKWHQKKKKKLNRAVFSGNCTNRHFPRDFHPKKVVVELLIMCALHIQKQDETTRRKKIFRLHMGVNDFVFYFSKKITIKITFFQWDHAQQMERENKRKKWFYLCVYIIFPTNILYNYLLGKLLCTEKSFIYT